jgi:hypothetical protein
MNKLTAVELLIDELLKKGFFKDSVTLTEIDHVEYKAKLFEKQQIEDAYKKSFENRHLPYLTAEKYYNNTYLNDTTT